MKRQECCSSRYRAKRKEEQEANRTHAIGDGAAKGNEPGGVQPQVHEVPVHQRVGEEGRHGRNRSARQHVGKSRIARRNEGERQRQPGVPVRRQAEADEVNGDHQPEHCEHAALHVEHRLVSAHRSLLMVTASPQGGRVNVSPPRQQPSFPCAAVCRAAGTVAAPRSAGAARRGASVPIRNEINGALSQGVALTGSPMDLQHKTSQTLFSYWDKVRGNRPMPRRFEIEPGKIARSCPRPSFSSASTPRRIATGLPARGCARYSAQSCAGPISSTAGLRPTGSLWFATLPRSPNRAPSRRSIWKRHPSRGPRRRSKCCCCRCCIPAMTSIACSARSPRSIRRIGWERCR